MNRGSTGALATIAAIAAFGPLAYSARGQGCAFRITELRIAQTGDDNDEYIEIESFAPGQAMDFWWYIVIGSAGKGDSGTIETVVPFTGIVVPNDGRVMVAESTFTLLPAAEVEVVIPLTFDEDDNKTHLIVSSFTGAVGQDLDTNDDGVLDVQPWSVTVCSLALIGPAAPGAGGAHVYSAVQVGPKNGQIPSHVRYCADVGGFKAGSLSLGPDDTPGVQNPECCPADLNEDTVVNVLDLLLMLGQWGPCGVVCEPDLNGDDTVNVLDLLLMLGAWGDCLA